MHWSNIEILKVSKYAEICNRNTDSEIIHDYRLCSIYQLFYYHQDLRYKMTI